MSRQLNNAIAAAAVRRWKQGERGIKSATIYDDLIAAGELIAPGAMDKAFTELATLAHPS